MDGTNTALLRAFIGFVETEATPSPPARAYWAFDERTPIANDPCVKETNKCKGVNIEGDAKISRKDGLRKMKDVSTIFISDDDDELIKKLAWDAPKGMYVHRNHHEKNKVHILEGSEFDNERALDRKPFNSNYKHGVHREVR